VTATAPLVLRADDGPVTTLTLNRPDKLNALDPGTLDQLDRHLAEIETSEVVRCVVLAGAGASFSAGNDLTKIAVLAPGEVNTVQAEVIDRLERLPVPTIAKIRGHCLTGGLELALGCDLLVAADTAKLADNHGRWGLIPLWGMSVRLPERVGRSRAKELMFTGRTVSGLEAAELGLVDRCVPEDELDGEVAGMCDSIVTQARGTLRIEKALLHAHAEPLRAAALRFERAMPFGFPLSEMEERLSSRR